MKALFKRLLAWIKVHIFRQKSASATIKVSDTEVYRHPIFLDTQFRDRNGPIGGPAIIENTSLLPVLLRGTLITVVVPACGKVRIQSPVLEVVKKDPGVGEHLREWDGLAVANDLVDEYLRGVAYDEMTPAELRDCTFPFPRRALARIQERVGLRAYREDLSVKA